MNFDFKQGALFAFSIVGCAFMIQSLLGAQLFTGLIVFWSGVFGLILIRRELVKARIHELQNGIKEQSGRIFYHGAYVRCGNESHAVTPEVTGCHAVTSQSQMIENDENDDIKLDRIGDFQGIEKKIPDNIYPDDCDLEYKKIIHLNSIGWSEREIAYGVFGYANGKKYEAIRDVLGR